MKVAIIGFKMAYNAYSQRGIDVIASTFAEIGGEVTFISYPTYLWDLRESARRILLRGIYYNEDSKSVFNRSVLVWIPYSLRIPHCLRKNFMGMYEWSHCNFYPSMDLNKFDIIVVESGKAVFMKDMIRGPKIIYRQSDPVSLASDDCLGKYEMEFMLQSDLILVVNDIIFERYYRTNKELISKAEVWQNGFNIPSVNYENPFKKSLNAVYMGLYPVNWDYIYSLCNEFKDMDVHVIGPHKSKKNYKNLICHGFLPHNEIIKYIAHAQICLLLYEQRPILQVCDTSSKLLMYMYFNKPIIANSFYGAERLKEQGVNVAETTDTFLDIVRQIVTHKDYFINYGIDLSKYEVSKRKEALISILKKRNFI